MEREFKSTCIISTCSNWDWFKKWQLFPLKRRGDDYDEMKNAIGEILIEQLFKLHPQIRGHIAVKIISSPVTMTHYLKSPHGEIYGLNHSIDRIEPLMSAKLRPQTDIPGK